MNGRPRRPSASALKRNPRRTLPWLAITVLAPAVSPTDTAGQVSGRVVYEPSGTPLPVAHVGLAGREERGFTDEHGRFTIPTDRTGTLSVFVQCPVTRRLGGRILGPTAVARPAGIDTLPWIRVPEGNCREPAEVERAVELEGVYRAGFERSTFVPCDGFEDLSHMAYGFDRIDAWVEFSDGFPELPEPLVRETVNGYRDGLWFLRVRGVLRGQGGYGHLGFSVFRLTVDSIIEARTASTDDCR